MKARLAGPPMPLAGAALKEVHEGALSRQPAPQEPYGLEMYIWRVRGEPMVGHAGQIDGFASAMVYLRRKGGAARQLP